MIRISHQADGVVNTLRDPLFLISIAGRLIFRAVEDDEIKQSA